MAKKTPKTEYERLRKIWYEKLKKKGFVDIESSETNFVQGNHHIVRFRRPRSLHSWRAKQAYYIMAEHFLNAYTFDTKLEHAIWEYHTNGMSVREIAQTLTKAKLKLTKDSVFAVVKRLREVMMKQAKYE